MSSGYTALTGYLRNLFGVDVHGGGLPVVQHANKLVFGSGFSATFNETSGNVDIESAVNSAPVWVPIFNVDFAALATQAAITTDGTVVIEGGFPFTASGLSSNAATLKSVRTVNGVGLEFAFSSTNNLNNCSGDYHSNKNCPLLSIPLSVLVLGSPKLTPSTPIRVRAVIAPLAGWAAPGDLTTIGIEVALENAISTDWASTIASFAHKVRAVSGSTLGEQRFLQNSKYAGAVNASSAGVTETNAALIACNTFGFDKPCGVIDPESTMVAGNAILPTFPAAMTWPDVANTYNVFRNIYSKAIPETHYVSASNMANWKLVIAAPASLNHMTSGSAKAVLRALRVEAFIA